ncbi:tagaturonate reductase [Paramaledivibacter caminithermalis]|uniref:Altronate oxidoreductase n=1 Tax=Paramaledivibacter caminithermalis (strain DSM 15212 / CIP 107654 / DViRD3) TaxID=1121301 RepID=A0A1M6NT61_PARC5|nr:tagaturonate reductase [Paramaledivibacter caminithermalis]SHJ98911.1 tagaturonate reductase [Paramaledivibacter caminithermalis DSM 15212]
MKKIQETYHKPKHTEKILQFGEGNFLRAFTDWMIDKMNKEADFDGGIIVIQPLKDGLIDVLNEQNGLYTLYLNGIKDNEVKRENTVIEAISRGIDPYSDYDKYLEVAKNPDLRFILSNTTEAGIDFDENDRLEDRPQKSFPGKLTALLFERFKIFNGDSGKGFIFIPCELIDKNGEKLKEIILKYADLWNLGEAFINWIDSSNIFCNSLVDRIVPGYPRDRINEITKELGYEDKLVVEGEQFHLWVIEAPDFVKREFPVNKAGLNVVFTDDLTPYRTRKVRILNGAHTSMVPVALLYGLETVRETVEDEVMGRFVKEAIFEEIVPTLDLPKEELDYFAGAVLDRFKNPFIKHLLMSISLNSNSKYETRVLPSVLEYKARKGKLPKKLVFSLAALIRFFKGDIDGKTIELKETVEIIDMYKKLWKSYDGTNNGLRKIVEHVLSQEKIWKMDLNTIEGLTDEVIRYLIQIEEYGIKEAISEVL